VKGNLCYKHPCLWKTGELPTNNVARTQGKPCAATKGVKNVNTETASVTAGPIATDEVSAQEENHLRYTSNSYQKILDYHVSEILLTTIIFGVLLLLRLHR
jgi:hypothetical protein